MRGFPFPFRREKTYTLILARRGEPLVIDQFKARGMEDAKRKAKELIEDLDPEQIPDLKRYKSFKVCPEDAESFADCERIRNPFFQPPQKMENNDKITAEDIEQVALAAVVQNIPNIVSNVLNMGMQLQQQVFTQVLSMYNRMLGIETDKNPVDKLLEVGQQMLELWKTQKEAESKPRKRPRILGENR